MSEGWPRTPPRKILLATDLSARSDRALDRAAQLARQWKSKLLVVHALEKAPVSSSWTQFDETPSWRRPPDPARAIELQIRRDVREEVDHLEICIRDGDPPDVVMAAAEREEADLIVLGTARSETLGRMLLGNTIEILVRKSPVSVLIVKNRSRGAYRHVLTGTDFTEESRHGLTIATGLFPEASHVLMHAFEMPYRALMTDTKLSHDFSAMEEATIKSFLDESKLPDDIRARVHTLIEHGPPESMLRKYVTEREADLAVVGAYSRSLAFHLLIGGTARRIVDAVPSDVLVVRAHRPAL
jgi:nucleotide-binding universal stress UspA family protein